MFESAASLRAEWIAACDAYEAAEDAGATSRDLRAANAYVTECWRAFERAAIDLSDCEHACESQRRAEVSRAVERIRRVAERLTEATGVKWTFGYIGNCDHTRDDRNWYLFAAHPGRVGSSADRIGGYATSDLPAFVPVAQGALSMALYLARQS